MVTRSAVMEKLWRMRQLERLKGERIKMTVLVSYLGLTQLCSKFCQIAILFRTS